MNMPLDLLHTRVPSLCMIREDLWYKLPKAVRKEVIWY